MAYCAINLIYRMFNSIRPILRVHGFYGAVCHVTIMSRPSVK